MQPTKDKPTGKGMVLTGRDREVVAAVADFQVLTRLQFIRLGYFGSKTRANARLASLVRFGYLSRQSLPALAGTTQALYFVGPRAASLLDKPAELVRQQRTRLKRVAELFLEHQLRLNDVRLAFATRSELKTESWLTDTTLRERQLGLIPDAYVEYICAGKSFSAFVELDRGTETLARWQGKTKAYLQVALSGRYQAAFGRRYFRVLVVALTAARLEHLRQEIGKQTNKIFWLTTLDRLVENGPVAAIWWRLSENGLHSLNEP